MAHSFSPFYWRDFVHACADNSNKRADLMPTLAQGPVSAAHRAMAVEGARATTRRLSMRKRASALAPAWGLCAGHGQNELFLELTDAAAEGLSAPERAIFLTDALISAATAANAAVCAELLEKGAKNKADEHYRSFFDPMGCLWRSREPDEKTEPCARALSPTLDASLRFTGSKWTHLALAALGPVFRPRAMAALLEAVPEQLTLLDGEGATPLQVALERGALASVPLEAASWLADQMSEDAVHDAFAAASRKIQVAAHGQGVFAGDAGAARERLARWGANREALALKAVGEENSARADSAQTPTKTAAKRL